MFKIYHVFFSNKHLLQVFLIILVTYLYKNSLMPILDQIACQKRLRVSFAFKFNFLTAWQHTLQKYFVMAHIFHSNCQEKMIYETYELILSHLRHHNIECCS